MKTNKNISPEIIKAYLAGTLSHAQTHEFEKAMLNNAVLRDLVEGYEIAKEQKVDFEKVKASLSGSLQERIRKEESEIYPLWKRVPLYARAASVVLFLGLGIYILTTQNKVNSEEKIAFISPQKEEKITNAKPQISPPNATVSEEKIKAEMTEITTENKVAIVIKKAKRKEIVSGDNVGGYSQGVVSESVMSEKEEVGEIPKATPPVISYDAPTVAAAPSAVMRSAGGTYVKKATLSPTIVSGVVLDEDTQKPVPNVEILANEKVIGKTDSNGQFNFEKREAKDKLNLVAPNFENTEINLNNNLGSELFIQPKAELIFIDLKRNKTWKYNPSEHPAQPSVSPDEYLEYLQKNLRKSAQVIDKQVVGEVVVSFKVNKDGKLSDFKVIKSLGYGCDEEAIRVILEGPVWLPKMVAGEPRRQRVIQTIIF
ncbi:energy transducer TonB [Arcicella sp. LKC2W]|uniref:energy transducer TonB n=1 Tax=Arcicella sp. LKC2W TaxID=2984198 RepID=UPI002B20D356|nr:energy transducer TonB [Arcicella sp. LKC2W]MEA5459296.1 energy transducer TonB [Arcicella sp. LKC2W]